MANRMLGAKMLTANKIGDIEGGGGLKCVKLKTGRSKSRKLSKFKKPLKIGNSFKFDAIENELSFLTPKARIAFNCLWLAFTNALTLWHYYLECYIWIEINALGYAIGGILNKLISGTSLNGVVTKADLS